MASEAEARTAWWCDGLLDWVVGALAAWTLVFHLARLVGASRDMALTIWLVVLLAGALALRKIRSAGSDERLAPATGTSAVQPSIWLPVAGGLAWHSFGYEVIFFSGATLAFISLLVSQKIDPEAILAEAGEEARKIATEPAS